MTTIATDASSGFEGRVDAPFDVTVRALIAAGEALDCEAFLATLSPSIIVRSPITQRIRFKGIDQVRHLFENVFTVIHGIQIYEHLGAGGPNQVIFWRGTVGRSTYLEEANLLKLDDQGRVCEMTVFMRAVPGLLELAAQLVPRLAARRGRWRSVVTGSLLRIFAAMYKANEGPIVRLSGVGTCVPDVPRHAAA